MLTQVLAGCWPLNTAKTVCVCDISLGGQVALMTGYSVIYSSLARLLI